MPTPSGHTTAIRSSRVIGTDVYNTEGDKIGEIEDVVLDKMSNNIMFAVVSFGGFLGMGEKFHPIPWALLDYDENKGGYVVEMSEEELKSAPADSISELVKNDGAAFRDATYAYYNQTPYW